MRDRLFVILQHLLPRYAMTAMVYRVALIRTPAFKNFLIRHFVRLFNVDLDGVREQVPEGFATFNDFFVRELDPDARPATADPAAILSPVDGTVSAIGDISRNSIFQAKGIDYALDDLLVVDQTRTDAFVDGKFATIYLAPYNYHRVHAPIAGQLDAIHYVPGDLFSVNSATVSAVRGLFRRNERLILHIRTPSGPAAVILVGALNVGSITTPWTGEVRPRRRGVTESIPLDRWPEIARGDLLGWFNMGSTVIVLLPRGAADWEAGLEAGATVVMGQTVGTLTRSFQ